MLETQYYHGKIKIEVMRKRLIRALAFIAAIVLMPTCGIEWIIRGKCLSQDLLDYAVQETKDK